MPPDHDEPQLTTRIRAGAGEDFPPPDARIKDQLMDAQETVFGINSNNYTSKKIINEQNYTSRAAGAGTNYRPNVMPSKNIAQKIPAEINRLTPISIQIQGYELYHFACYNVG